MLFYPYLTVEFQRRRWHPTSVLLAGKSHEWRSLVCCSPWGREESDTTERVPFHVSLSCIGEGNGNPLQCSCVENSREPGGLPSMGSHRVRHNWSDLAAVAAVTVEFTGTKYIYIVVQVSPSSIPRIFHFPTKMLAPLKVGWFCFFAITNHVVSILCISLGAYCASSSCGDLYLCVQLLSLVQMFATPWTIVHHASLSMELSRQQYWSGFPYSSPGDLPGSGIKLMSPALASGFFSTEPLGETSWGNQFSSVQLLSRVWLFATPWTAAHQASLSIIISWSSPKLICIESMMPSSHLILCRPLFLLPPIPPSIRVFSNESTLLMSWPKYWSFPFSIIPSKEHPGLISFRMDWLDLLAVFSIS